MLGLIKKDRRVVTSSGNEFFCSVINISFVLDTDANQLILFLCLYLEIVYFSIRLVCGSERFRETFIEANSHNG